MKVKSCGTLVLAITSGTCLLHTEDRFAKEQGWKPLLDGRDLAGWHGKDGKPQTWFTATKVEWDAAKSPERLIATEAPGSILVNGPNGKTTNLVTDDKFGDIQLHVEFELAKKSNSGVYVHGLYEVQILDSYGKDVPNVHDCGAIYERWIDGKGVGGSPPRRNVSRPPGEWQSFDISFRAPRFDASGAKTENAKFLRVVQNGVVIQENVEVDGPTRAAMDIPEAAVNPIMLQGDHGPIAFRNLYVRPLAAVKSVRRTSSH